MATRVIRSVVIGSLLWSAGMQSIHAAVSKRTYERKAEAQIDSLASDIRKAEHKAAHVGAADRDEFSETIKHLWAKEKLARQTIEKIRRAPSNQWSTLRREEDSLLIHLKKSYQHLVNRYFK